MSVEKQARSALRWMLFWRLVGELFTLPQIVCACISGLFSGIAGLFAGFRGWFRNLEMAIFCLELNAARRYKLITGLDLATAAGDPGRYGSLDPERAETIQQRYMRSRVAEEDE